MNEVLFYAECIWIIILNNGFKAQLFQTMFCKYKYKHKKKA